MFLFKNSLTMKIQDEVTFPNNLSFFINLRVSNKGISKKGDVDYILLFHKDKDGNETSMEVPLAKGFEKQFEAIKHLRLVHRIASPVMDIQRTNDAKISAYSLKEVIIKRVEESKNDKKSFTLILQAPSGQFDEAFTNLNANLQNPFFKQEEMILYLPIPASDEEKSAKYPYKELISKKVLDHLKANPHPFNAGFNATSNKYVEVIDQREISYGKIPKELIPKCSTRKNEIVGLYSGGARHFGHVYHACGQCMMRSHILKEEERHLFFFKKTEVIILQLCAVCKYILVNQIDPSKHVDLDKHYASRKIYPE
jgi:hypothetical protein